MSFKEYIQDKRYFLLFYVILLIFISLMMVVSVNEKYAFSYILYTNICCFVLLILYIYIGFHYRNKFYRELSQWVESEQDEIFVEMLEPQNNNQKLMLTLLHKMNENYSRKVHQLHDDRRDHQEFILSWIHEVKLPIAAGRLLIENSEGRSAEWLADKFEDELDKINHYVEQALYYSRIDSFSKDYFITEVHLNQLVKSSVKKYSKLFINKRIQFQMESVDQFVQSDRKWLGFILDQIIVNSLKYTNEGGEITVRFEKDGKEKRLFIQDNGIGIKREDLNRVFEKGFTGSIGRSHVKSTGIGLYLAKQLANKLGHEISIESEEGEFTRMVIHFPKVRNYFHLDS